MIEEQGNVITIWRQSLSPHLRVIDYAEEHRVSTRGQVVP